MTPTPSSDRMRFVGPMDRALFLRSMPFFQGVPVSDLAIFAHHLRERFFKSGSVLLRPGEPVGAMYIVVEGRVRTVGGEYPRDAIVGPEQSVGFLSFLSRSRDGVLAVAETDTLALEFDGDVLLDVYEDHFHMLVHVMRMIASQTLRSRSQTPDGAFLGQREPVMTVGERPLDLVERIILMRTGSVFSRANLDVVSQLASILREVRFPAGQTLWRAGDRADCAYVIVSGTVECQLDDGARRFRCGPRYPLGNVETTANYPRWYDAITETPLVALRTEPERFLDVLEDHFDVAIDFVGTMAAGLVQILREERLRESGGAAGEPEARGAVRASELTSR